MASLENEIKPGRELIIPTYLDMGSRESFTGASHGSSSIFIPANFLGIISLYCLCFNHAHLASYRQLS